ncbi:integrase catalytic domain-containing protein [Trichonephila clavipes]|uniref:Integrase catalytic domain-containing protein n=1 Tax=Trichonephila clavipes TaxID=2585209 RepID=A0A8X6RLZ6_TRICX|nr:integrase catalytic domain-containing protein [Trichonephila clavipes]
MWCHIPGTLNAADLVSRGCSGEHLLQGKWWEGPTWLLENEENRPKSEDEPDEDWVNSEKRKTIVTTLTKADENVNWYYLDLRWFKLHHMPSSIVKQLLHPCSDRRWRYYALEKVLRVDLEALVLIEGTMIVVDYLSIIMDQLHPYIGSIIPTGNGIFQQDSVP